MAVLYDFTGEAINRSVGSFIDPTQDFSVCVWGRGNSSFPAAANYRTFYHLMDAGYVAYLGFYGVDTGSIQLYCANGLDPDKFIDFASTIDIDYHLALTYEALTKTFEYYVNGVSHGTFVLDMSTAVFVTEWQGDDGNLAWSSTVTSYFRSWQKKLTVAQVIAEMGATSAVLTTDLFEDVPLTSDYLDHSGNGRNWSAVGATTFIASSPVNQYYISATDLGALPASVSQNVHDAGTTYTVWYKFTAPIGSNVIGAFGFGDLVTYKPTIFPWIAGPTNILSIAAQNKPIQFPVTPGTEYYLEFRKNAGNPNPALLLITVEVASSAVVSGGSIFVNDDAPGFPAVIIDPNTSSVTSFVSPFPSSEAGDILENGKFLINDQTDSSVVKFYDSSFNLISSPAFAYIGLNPYIRTNNELDVFYVASGGSGLTHATVTTILADGTLGPDTWGPFASAGLSAIASNIDGSKIYYSGSGGSGNSQIKQWDTATNLALADLIAVVAGYKTFDILVLSDDSLIVGYFKSTVAQDVIIKHFDNTGALLDTYSLGGGWDSTDPRLAYAVDSPNSFWFWGHIVASGKSQFLNIKVSNGSSLNDVQLVEFEGGAYNGPATATPANNFGNSFSCPFFILRASGANSSSGLYKMVPGSNKRYDTVYTSFNPITTTDLTIPNPFFKTGLIGE